MARVGDAAAPRVAVVDLEATCWVPEDDPALAADQRNESEVIEIGAVLVDAETYAPAPVEPFRAVVRPRRHPRLSAFCTRLTGIGQDEVDEAPRFPAVYDAFLAWAGGDEGLVLASWGAFDDRQLRRDAERWGLREPRWTHLNVKRVFARARGKGRPGGGWIGLSAAVTELGGVFEGRPHSALADARNVAWVLARLGRSFC